MPFKLEKIYQRFLSLLVSFSLVFSQTFVITFGYGIPKAWAKDEPVVVIRFTEEERERHQLQTRVTKALEHLLEVSSFAMDAATSQELQESYTSSADINTELIRNSNLLGLLEQAFQAAEKFSPNNTKSIDVVHQVYNLYASFTIQILLAKNGHERALLKELEYFIELLVLLNSEINRLSSLTESDKSNLAQSLFRDMTKIKLKIFENSSHQERLQIDRFIQQLGRQIFKSDFSELVNILKENALTDKYSEITMSVFFIIFLSTFSAGTSVFLNYLDGINILSLVLSAGTLFSSLVIGAKATPLVMKPFIPISDDMSRMQQEARNSCLGFLSVDGLNHD